MKSPFPDANGKGIIDQIASQRSMPELMVTRENGDRLPFQNWAKLWVTKNIDNIPIQGY